MTRLIILHRLFGRTVALSIFHHRLIDVRFAPTFYKAMLGQTPTLADLKDVDKSLYQSLVWTLGNSVSGVLDEQTFSYEEDRFGETIVVELVKHGAMIQVTEENKREYVNALVESKIAGRTKEQFDSFMAGFDEIFPRALLKVFTPAELEVRPCLFAWFDSLRAHLTDVALDLSAGAHLW